MNLVVSLPNKHFKNYKQPHIVYDVFKGFNLLILKACMSAFRYDVNLLDKYNKILQNARYKHQDLLYILCYFSYLTALEGHS